MNNIFVLLGFCSLFIGVNPLQAQEKCDLTRHYNEFIRIEKTVYEGEEYVDDVIGEVDENYCFSKAVNVNLRSFEYILTNFKTRLDYDKFKAISDTVVMQKVYIEDLKKDSLFNAVIADYSSKVLEKSIAKDTVTMTQLVNFAAKFFAIVNINEGGSYVGKVCVGINDIEKTEPKRHAFAEAFCFSTIIENYQGEQFSMYDEFVAAMIELYTVNLGIDKTERLFRAQGAMYMLMTKNENLRKMLKSTYDTQRDYLPFLLKV